MSTLTNAYRPFDKQQEVPNPFQSFIRTTENHSFFVTCSDTKHLPSDPDFLPMVDKNIRWVDEISNTYGSPMEEDLLHASGMLHLDGKLQGDNPT